MSIEEINALIARLEELRARADEQKAESDRAFADTSGSAKPVELNLPRLDDDLKALQPATRYWAAVTEQGIKVDMTVLLCTQVLRVLVEIQESLRPPASVEPSEPTTPPEPPTNEPDVAVVVGGDGSPG